jgi:hypothetical protein
VTVLAIVTAAHSLGDSISPDCTQLSFRVIEQRNTRGRQFVPRSTIAYLYRETRSWKPRQLVEKVFSSKKWICFGYSLLSSGALALSRSRRTTLAFIGSTSVCDQRNRVATFDIWSSRARSPRLGFEHLGALRRCNVLTCRHTVSLSLFFTILWGDFESNRSFIRSSSGGEW